VNSFKVFFERNNFNPDFNKKTGEARQHRHLNDMIPDVSSHTKTGGKTVPEYCKSDNNAVQEFEALKNMNSGVKVINQVKAQQLKQQFNLKDFNSTLGNTKISIAPHTTPGLYILRK